jgi:peptidoglycan/LPS O-acetylase OafA/YrhL
MLTVVAIVTVMQWLAPPRGSDQAVWIRIVTGIPLAICFGVILAHLLHERRTYEALRWLFGWRTSSVVFACALLLCLNTSQPPFVVHLAAALLVGACVYREDHWLAPLLNVRALAFVGSVSYGIYLLHMLVKNAVTKLVGTVGLASDGPMIFLLTAAGSIALAAASYRYFESAFLRRKKRYAAA